MKRGLRIISILAVVISVVMLSGGIQTTPATIVAAPQEQELEEIEKELEGFLGDLMEVQGVLLELERRAWKVQSIDEVFEIERTNWEVENKIHNIEASFLPVEEKFLNIKKEKVYEAKEAKELERILFLLKVEEEVALVKAKIAASWLESSMIEEKLAVFKKRYFLDP